MILTVIGARPQFVKASVVSLALKNIGLEELIIHTGQHYDESMSDVFWNELDIPKPYKNLAIGSGLQGEQTAQIMMALEKEVIQLKPNAILVYGDTNSTLAAAIVASKLCIKLIHIEAGLRSFNKTMPEEINRIVTDRLSDILFCSSNEGIDQLIKEGINYEIHNVGDVMYDAFIKFQQIAERKFKISGIIPFDFEPFLLATIHRPANTDNAEKIKDILEAFSELPFKIVWPLHPRNKTHISKQKIPDNLFIIQPTSYLQMLVLLNACSKVCTDSGGLQKEAYWAKKPCITLREETEWVETLEGDWNILVGSNKSKIIDAIEKKIEISSWKELYGDGNASQKIASIIKDKIQNNSYSIGN